MKFRFGSLWLASGGVESAAGITVNGAQVNDQVAFYRALYASLFARGGRSFTIAFSVTRRFDTVREAQRFALEHFAAVPEQDDLFVWLGTDADEEICRFEDAVVDGVSVTPNGMTAVAQYTFRCGQPHLDSPAPSYAEPDADMIKRDTSAIANGASSLDVAFAAPFAGTPHVVVSMQTPSGGDVIAARVREGSVTAAGFTADLSAPVPASGYKLSWIAVA